MKNLAVRSRLRLLGLVLALSLTLAALGSSASAVGDWSGCGDPYYRTVLSSITIWTPWAGFITIPWYETQACANCDQGTACYET